MCGMNAETLKGAEKIENKFSALIKDSAIEVHRVLGGPGLLESLYEEALFRELQSRGIPVIRQVHLPVKYKGIPLQTSQLLIKLR